MLIVGKILLILLGIIIFFVLLVLFFPIGYKVYLKRGTEGFTAKVQGTWLLGLLRFCYSYPRPGDFRVKLAFITLYRSSREKPKKNRSGSGAKNKREKQEETKKEHEKESKKESKKKPEREPGKQPEKEPGRESIRSAGQERPEAGTETMSSREEQGSDGGRREETEKEYREDEDKTGGPRNIFTKIKKIKYTIQMVCDIIKNIFENIVFYKELLERKDTKEILVYGGRRIGSILKHIRPRSLKAEFLIGTGSPDTTAYLLAGYDILIPWIGRPEDISLNVDFEQAVLEGNVRVRGYITLFHILSNGMFLLLDKRIRRLYEEIKKHGRGKTLAAN